MSEGQLDRKYFNGFWTIIKKKDSSAFVDKGTLCLYLEQAWTVPVETPLTDNRALEESSSCLFCCSVENNKCPKSSRWKVKGLFELTIRKSGQKVQSTLIFSLVNFRSCFYSCVQHLGQLCFCFFKAFHKYI